jgi:hypothetical protein
MFLWGAPGVGKSDLVTQVAKDLDYELRDVRLSLMDPTDIKGFPVPDTKKGLMRWLPADFLPTSGKGILFLDELTQAPAAVQGAALQLTLNRKIGEYTLPDGWAVVAAGNRTTDRSGTHAMLAALSNRFVHLDYHVDPEDWIDWAIANGISDATRGYIRYRPANLSTERIEVGMRSFPTPRTWAFADNIVGSGLPPEVEMAMIGGTVGEGIAAEYLGFVREAKNLPNIDMILLDPNAVPVPESPSTCYAITSALESRTTGSNFGRLLKYVARMSKEFEVVYVTSVTKRDKSIAETTEFVDWCRENRSALM